MIEIITNNLKGNFQIVDPGLWWYLHGKLENIVGYDKGCALSKIQPGENDVKVIGIEEPCIGFFWLDSMNRLRGLVCLKSDEEAVQEAREKMNRKDDFI